MNMNQGNDVTVDIEYVSAGCNPYPNMVSWGSNDLIAYGCCNSVIVYDPKFYSDCGKVIKTLYGHQKAITGLKWIRIFQNTKKAEIISSSADGSFIIWKYYEDKHKKVQVYSSEISLIDAFYTDFDALSLTVIAFSSNDIATVWFRPSYNGDLNNIQQLHLRNELCTAVDSYYFKIDNEYMLITALALTNSEIELYSWNYNNKLLDKIINFISKSNDWIRSFSFREYEGDIFLLSSSQDDYIRLYQIKIKKNNETLEQEINELRPNILEQNINSIEIISCAKFNQFSLSVRLETVIYVNERSVYEINWSPKLYYENGQFEQPLEFISCSIGKSVIIWQLDKANTGLWVEKFRFGQIGGNSLGFYGCQYSPNGLSFVANNYQGSLHLLNISKDDETNWNSGIIVSGHFSEVHDISWDPTGEFIVSVSSDKTSRIHAQWKVSKLTENQIRTTWHEISRPQVHGHSIFCVATISRYIFVSGAEEKILRVFKAPVNFLHNFHKISQIEDEFMEDMESAPKGALVPSLGLSNQAVYSQKSDVETCSKTKDNNFDDSRDYYFNFESKFFDVPPNEELLEGTLWPEIQKLYGHGYEIFAVVCSPNGEFLASTCKSTNTEFASIIIWDVSTWEICDKLTHHNLTVTQIEFSPDSEKLLAVSRDRTWSMYEKIPDRKNFEKVAFSTKTNGVHTRIIWACSWSYDSKYFVTGSREGKVVLWYSSNYRNMLLGQSQYRTMLNFSIPVTALCFAPNAFFKSDGNYLLAIGFEDGNIQLYKWSMDLNWAKMNLICENIG